MPLILSVEEGDVLFVGDVTVRVDTIFGDGRCSVMVGDEEHLIGDNHATEIVPEVLVSAGLLGNNAKFVRLIFNAPRSIGIGRFDPHEVEPCPQ